MGKLVSYLCGVLGRHKPAAPAPADDSPKPENTSDLSSTSSTQTPSGAEDDQPKDNAQLDDQAPSLPPPPGGGHMRTTSCHLNHERSKSISSKLVSKSMRILGSGGGEEKKEGKKSKLKHEDSLWKKPIILGERCKVPEEDEDSILYDEKGNRISTFHTRTYSGLASISRHQEPSTK